MVLEGALELEEDAVAAGDERVVFNGVSDRGAVETPDVALIELNNSRAAW